ncbi:glycosyltransferase [Ralstonia insidiosa]|uniref:Glycosyl transferase family 2 n=1 Tax=Ralstonia insidiosa TaxID=190721 RepID=A0A192A557_9RALS|nr:glycosyltransferase family 2 protein [Ralstonia insidiosa]ANJ75478.1 glycosyl transferase family 2 [Ralstonia insidiosa]KAB0469731.1 glycosyltransferase family 2 protein [Ralstonia insidiosa]MBY4910439.1 glycosyltransferase [Ralstonia insidiosa]
MEPTKTMPADAITLSICIPTYNRARYLENLLKELTAQIGGLRHSYELLIGDNCSSDTTEQVVAEYQDKLNIRYFRRPSNLGSAENMNQLYRSAQGKYVLYHADDDLPILAEINNNLDIFERNPAVGVIFAPWLIHDLAAQQDITPFYRQDDDYLIEQRDYAKLLALILSHHIFPEIYLARREVIDKLYYSAPEHAFWAFAHAAEMLGSYALYFSKTPFYRSVTRYFADETRTQAGSEEVKHAWDRYRGGLEYLFGKFSHTVPASERPEWLNAINQFVLARMKVALRLRTHEGGHWIDNYYIANRVRALGEASDLPASYDLYRVNAAFECLTKLDPFKPEPPKYATLRRAPLQIFPHAQDFAGTEFLVLDDDAAIPQHTIVVTPIPMDIPVPAGREVRFVSELETLAKFP